MAALPAGLGSGLLFEDGCCLKMGLGSGLFEDGVRIRVSIGIPELSSLPRDYEGGEWLARLWWSSSTEQSQLASYLHC